MLVLRPSKIPKAGVGVFTTEVIKKGVEAPLFAKGERYKLIKTNKPDFLTKRFCPYDKPRKGYWCPQDFHRMSIGWYINHSAKPNISATNWKTTRFIRPGEELTTDYSKL